VAAAGHHDIHVGFAFGVLGVVEVENRHAFVHANGHRRDEIRNRHAREQTAIDQTAHGVVQGDEGAGDARRARAAIGLDDVAVELHGALPERGEVHDGSQTATDEALDFLRAAGLLAAGGFPVAACVGRAGQHAVLCRDPALALAPQERRDLLLDAGGAENSGVTELHEDGALGVARVVTVDAHGAQFVCGTAAWSHRSASCSGLFFGAAAARAGRVGDGCAIFPSCHSRAHLPVCKDRPHDL
jgi:hypothetical protein